MQPRPAPFDPRDPRDPLDPHVEACIVDALAPLRGLVPAEVAGEMRAVLALLLEAHPVLAPMLEGLRPRPVLAASGDVAREEAPSARADEPMAKATGRAGQGSR